MNQFKQDDLLCLGLFSFCECLNFVLNTTLSPLSYTAYILIMIQKKYLIMLHTVKYKYFFVLDEKITCKFIYELDIYHLKLLI